MLKKLLVMLLIMGLIISLAACGNNATPKETTSEKPSEEKTEEPEKVVDKSTLTIAINADMGTLDPGVSMDNLAWKITYPTYERLVEFDGSSTEVKAGLAKKWELSEDGLKWKFYLEQGHKFADGTDVNADAVKFTFDRILKIGKGPSDTFGVIESVEVIDPYKVEFTLKNPFPPFISTLAANYGGIVNPKVMDNEKDGDLAQGYLASNTAGSGVYQLSEWKKGEYIKLTLNPSTSADPAFKTVFFKLIPDASGARLQLERKDIDIAEGIPVDQLKELENNEDIAMVQEPSLFVDYVYVNSTKGNEALKNPKVRQAISYAIDYDSIVNQVMQGYATQMRGPIPEGLWGHDENAKQYTYDVETAKKLFTEVGVNSLELDLLYADRFPNWEQEALIIQANLADIGISVNLSKVAYATMREMLDTGDFDLAMGVWSPDYGDPFMFMNYWFDSENQGLAGNRAFYTNEKVDELIREAAKISDRQKREELYKEAQAIAIDEAPYLYLYQRDAVLPMLKELKGYVYNPMLEGIYNLSEMSK